MDSAICFGVEFVTLHTGPFRFSLSDGESDEMHVDTMSQATNFARRNQVEGA